MAPPLRLSNDRKLLRRLCTGVLMVIWILAPYALLQRCEVQPVTWMKESGIDRAIPLFFPATWVYLSYFVMLIWVWLRVSDQQYMRYVYATGWVVLVSHMVFLFFPTGLSRESLPDGPWYYQWIAVVDEPRNALPSLHASLSILVILVVAAEKGAALWKRIGMTAWGVAILWSAIAIRQHVAIDLLAGAILAFIVWMAVRKRTVTV